MTDAQKGFLQTLITQCTDNGLDELAAQAKQYLNSGKTSKVTCSDMISKLKNALS
jgi:DNA polymerase III gamma/tau subunit